MILQLVQHASVSLHSASSRNWHESASQHLFAVVWQKSARTLVESMPTPYGPQSHVSPASTYPLPQTAAPYLCVGRLFRQVPAPVLVHAV